MADYASIPGSDYYGDSDANVLFADTDLPSALNNLISTYGGDDMIFAGRGDDVVYGGTGNDDIFGDAGNDIAFGGNGSDDVFGGKGNDILFGNKDADRLDGGDGNDAIFGGRGADYITGGKGADLLDGGKDADTFFFDNGFGADIVLDFKAGEDMLAIKSGINGLDIGSTADLAAYVGGNAEAASITLGGDTITLVGVSRADLLANLDDYVKIV